MCELVNNCVINVQNIAKVYISGEIMKNFQKRKSTHSCKNARLAENIHKSYVGNTGLIVHWDGKLLPDNGVEKVDRLPVIVSDSQGTAKLLSVPKLPAGTREATASAVLHCLREW